MSIINKLILKTFLITALSLTSLSGCDTSEDELALRENITSMRKAITSHKPEQLMQHIDSSYKSPAHLNFKALNTFVNYHLSNNRVIHLYLADIEIDIDGDSAKVIFYSGVAGGPNQIPERGRLFKVGTRWLKTDGQWKVTQAKWRPALIPKK